MVPLGESILKVDAIEFEKSCTNLRIVEYIRAKIGKLLQVDIKEKKDNEIEMKKRRKHLTDLSIKQIRCQEL